MQNGYFRLVKAPGGYGIRFFAPRDGGQNILIADVLHYFERTSVPYDASQIKKYIAEKKDAVCFLARQDCPAIDEMYQLEISDDRMEAAVYFFPPSETGKRLSMEGFLGDLRLKNITSGIKTDVIRQHFETNGMFCTRLVIAVGKEPRHGKDAKIEYFFNTDVHARPTMREDGTVDFYHLNVINHCRENEVLARLIPEDPGEAGMDISGGRIPPRTVKKAVLKFGRNIRLSGDKKEITSMVNGHVMLVDDKVFVSDVYEVENVDLSTGNVEFEGSVQINGNVVSNYVVKAGGNVIINGVVEGAHIIAGGNIIIARGMNGKGKGTLEAGGNIVVKFLENATAQAGDSVSAEAILHSYVNAGTEIMVVGRRGSVTGGHIQAANRVLAKNLGAVMGAATIVEVGTNAEVKAEYIQLQKEVMEAAKIVKTTQPAIASFYEKRAKGVSFTKEQMKYLKEAARLYEEKREELKLKNEKMQGLQALIDSQKKAEVVVEGTAYPGTTVIIGDASMSLQKNYQYCRFEKKSGDVKMVPM